MYKINESFTTRAFILKPTYNKSKGVIEKIYPTFEEGVPFNCSFKTFGGTQILTEEKNVNDIIQVIDTAILETWYRPDITSDCRIALTKDIVYDVLGSPENISNRNQYLKIKLKRYNGGA